VTWFGTSVAVELGFGSAPLGTVSWTDVSAYVRSIRWRRGRWSSEFDGFDAGSCTLTLDDTDRRFDPDHASGPYFGDITLNVPLRVTVGGTVQFYGYVESWGVQWYVHDNFAERIVSATDGFRLLAQRRVDDSPFGAEVRFDTPVWWYRLGETGGATLRDSGSAGKHLTSYNADNYAARNGLVKYSADGAQAWDGVDDYAEVASVTLTPPFTVFVATVVTTAGRRNPLVSLAGTGTEAFVFEITSADKLKVTYNDGTDERSTITDAAVADLDQVQFFTCVVRTGAAPILYQNLAQPAQTGSGSGTLGAITGTLRLARVGTDYYAGVLDEACYFAEDLSLTESASGGGTRMDDYYAAGHPSSGTVAWEDDDPNARASKILAMVGWPTGLRALDDYSTAQFGPAKLDRRPALQCLREVEVSDSGWLFMARDGKVTWQDRDGRYQTASAQLVSQATFSDDEAATLKYSRLVPDGYSPAWIANRIRARWVNGEVVEVEDTTSQAAMELIEEDLGELLLDSRAQVETLLEVRLARRKDPRLRFVELGYSGRHGAAYVTEATTREIGHRVTVERTPTDVGSALSLECWVDGIEQEMDEAGMWDVRYRLSPVVPQS
jgi:hypothetical protein